MILKLAGRGTLKLSIYGVAMALAAYGGALPALSQEQAPGIHAGAAPEPSRRVRRPSVNSLEYRLNWGLEAIDARRAYHKGVSGSGVTVAMIDTGVAAAPADMFERLSPASTDLIARRALGSEKADHGEQTAGLLAAALDGKGSVGVAYGVTLLSIRADIDGSCRTECAVHGADLARGIDYALDHGAKVIGVPLVGPHRLPNVEPALERAVAAGAVIVAAAGNDGAQAPAWPARYAADPRFAKALIVAGASTPRGELARWTSKAGDVGSRFVAAPGEHLLVDCGTRYCRLASGTSYSVSYVAGALALLMEARPDLKARQAADLLLEGAAPRRSTDHAAGSGILDVEHALRLARLDVPTHPR